MPSDNNHDFKLNNYKDIFESIPTSLLIINSNGEIVYINRQTEVLFGYERQNLLGKEVDMLIPQRYRDVHGTYHEQFFRNPSARPMGEGRELYALNSKGVEFPVEIALTPLQTDMDRTVLVTVLDLTYRKKTEQTIRESEEKLQAIIDNSPDSVLVYNTSGEILSMNKESRKIFGGMDRTGTVWEIIPKGSRNLFSEILSSVKMGNRFVDWESEVIKHEGNRMPASISLYYIQDGNGIFVETIRDITDRINLRNKIVEYEKNKIVAKMSEGIAHHMGTPLASMLLRVQMMQEDLAESPDGKDYVKTLGSIERQILYGQKIMQKLLKFASSSFDEKHETDLSSLIRDSLDIIKPLWSNSSVEFSYDQEEEFTIFADSDMIKLVLSDLLMNATDAVSGLDKAEIRLQVRRHDSSAKKVMITISDTGNGIPRDVLPYIFDPFFSTKPAGKGTGLGLSVAKNVISDHNGEINIESQSGHGTKVNIILPAAR